MGIRSRLSSRSSNDNASKVIVGGEVVSVNALKRKAGRASRRFWSVAIVFALMTSMIMPYMSLAASVSPTNTNVFTGNVVPGYSMGGVVVSAYGVDINDWGKVTADKPIQSNYGVWSGQRGQSATDRLSKDKDAFVQLSGDASANVELNTADKSKGWDAITGKHGYSSSSPDGTSNNATSTQIDQVAPYRTVNDFNYWDGQVPNSSSADSADIEVSLFADFIIVSFDADGNPHVLTSPDDVDSGGVLYTGGDSSDNTYGSNTKVSTAIPYYIPLSALFDAANITDAQDASISSLMDAIGKDGNIIKTALNNSNSGLLNGTPYKALNSDVVGSSTTSTAFNPYPYTMVFSMNRDNGIVTSSMYENSEAYVYFSPSSVYTAYMNVKQEYENLLTNATRQLPKTGKQDPTTVFQMGYYMAEMSILEAYLDESLPQDMTRGYVGSTESGTAIGNSVPGDGNSNLSGDKESLKQTPYASLMYDVSKNIDIVSGKDYRLAETDAIMDTLSTFGYSFKTSQDGASYGYDGQNQTTGVMKGMTALATQRRLTIYTPYQTKGTIESDASDKSSEERGSAGLYSPTYYPIQQHKMPDAEKSYRFQILSTIPYSNLLEYIKNGFSSGVSFTYKTNQQSASNGEDVNYNSGSKTLSDITDSLQSTGDLADSVSALAAQYDKQEQQGFEDPSMTLANANGSQLSTEQISIGGSPDSDDGDDTLTARIDSALTNYSTSSMSSLNVHDFEDVLRATLRLKYESWFRYYNPLKSEGGDTDIFLARVSPALTTYFPSILVKGYTPAGGNSVDNGLTPYNCSFDYFSIPSLAPCIASHCADDTYYGALNYELRAFYSAGFIETLSSSSNIPAVEQYNQAMDQEQQAKDNNRYETANMKTNISTLYIVCKRLAAIKAVRNFTKAISKDEAESEGFKHDVTVKGGTITVWGKLWSEPQTTQFKMQGTDNSNSEILGTNGAAGDARLGLILGGPVGPYDSKDTDIRRTNGNANSYLTSSDYYRALHVEFPDGEDLTSQGVLTRVFDQADLGRVNNAVYYGSDVPVDNGTVDNRDDSGAEISSSGLKARTPDHEIEVMDSVDLFQLVYENELEQLIGQNGDYYWENMDTISKNMQENPNEWSADWTEAHDRHADEMYKYTVYLDTGAGSWLEQKLGNKDISIVSQDVIDAYQQNIDDICTQIGISVVNLMKDQNLLINNMPTQMQNCLAWADYQNSSDSEGQYQADPTDANVTINVSQEASNPSNASSDDSSAPSIKGKRDLAKYGIGYNDSTYEATGNTSDNADKEDSAVQARMKRGVEGSTYTSTIQPAIYTMSATIGRIEYMTSDTGTSYPYSGLANGRLQSGTDKYAVMQAHVIDYSSISSNIAGDLSTRQRSKTVSVTDPQYASITDFLSSMNIFGAFLGEIGSTALKNASGMFSSMMFSNNSSQSGMSSDGVAVSASSGSNSANSAPSQVVYTTRDGVTMSRVPASLASFDNTTGKLTYSSAGNDSNNGYADVMSADAASASGVVSRLAPAIITVFSPLYSVMQTIGLTLVMFFIGFIAFQNFFAYAVMNDAKAVQARAQLKVVLPRAIIACFMIGLPPLAIGTSTGFEGGNFILLELINNVIDYICNIFINMNGSSVMDLFTNVDLASSFGNDIGLIIVYFLACLWLALLFIIGTVVILIQSLILFVFFLVGPIIWSFYVWPYKIAGEETSLRGSNSEEMQYTVSPMERMKNAIGSKTNFGILTGGQSGDVAPIGHVLQYIQLAMLSLVWSLGFWMVAMLFVTMSGTSSTVGGDANAAVLTATGVANAASNGGNSFLNLYVSNVPAILRIVFAVLIATIVFILMAMSLINQLKRTWKNTGGMFGTLGSSIKNGITNMRSTAAETAGHVANTAQTMKNAGRKIKENASKMKNQGAYAKKRAADIVKDTRNAAQNGGGALSGAKQLGKSIVAEPLKNAGQKAKNDLQRAGMILTDPEKAKQLQEILKSGRGKPGDKYGIGEVSSIAAMHNIAQAKKAIGDANTEKALLGEAGKALNTIRNKGLASADEVKAEGFSPRIVKALQQAGALDKSGNIVTSKMAAAQANLQSRASRLDDQIAMNQRKQDKAEAVLAKWGEDSPAIQGNIKKAKSLSDDMNAKMLDKAIKRPVRNKGFVEDTDEDSLKALMGDGDSEEALKAVSGALSSEGFIQKWKKNGTLGEYKQRVDEVKQSADAAQQQAKDMKSSMEESVNKAREEGQSKESIEALEKKLQEKAYEEGISIARKLSDTISANLVGTDDNDRGELLRRFDISDAPTAENVVKAYMNLARDGADYSAISSIAVLMQSDNQDAVVCGGLKQALREQLKELMPQAKELSQQYKDITARQQDLISKIRNSTDDDKKAIQDQLMVLSQQKQEMKDQIDDIVKVNKTYDHVKSLEKQLASTQGEDYDKLAQQRDQMMDSFVKSEMDKSNKGNPDKRTAASSPRGGQG